MAFVTYTAKRRLIGAHVSGNSYSIDFGVASADPGDGGNVNVIKSMGGRPSSVLMRIDEPWVIATTNINYSDIDTWREFVQSVINKEYFTFDPDGTSASPSNSQTVYMESQSIRYSRNFTFFKAQFEVIKAPS